MKVSLTRRRKSTQMAPQTRYPETAPGPLISQASKRPEHITSMMLIIMPAQRHLISLKMFMMMFSVKHSKHLFTNVQGLPKRPI